VLNDLSQISLLLRREIEARITAPLIKQMASRFGEAETLAEVTKVIHELAGESGAQFAESVGSNSMTEFPKVLELFKQNGALEIDILKQDEQELIFNVTRCRYAEMYRDLGISAELGSVLSCERDAALGEGFNPRIKLARTQTIMSGAESCDFRFHLEA
jgi:hypothetical protein